MRPFDIELADEGSVGIITYMRTDSTNVSPQAQAESREFVAARFGNDYLPDQTPI